MAQTHIGRRNLLRLVGGAMVVPLLRSPARAVASHVVDLEDLGVIGDEANAANAGTRDNSAAWNAAMAAVRPGSTIVLPPNYISFTKPIASLPSNCRLVGSGQGSHLVRCFNQSPRDIFLTTGITDCAVENVRLWAADGTSGGIAIGRWASSQNDAPFHTVVRGVEWTRFNTGRWAVGMAFDGVAGPPHYGARRLEFLDIIGSGATEIGIWLGGVNNVSGANITPDTSGATWGLWVYGNAENSSNIVSLDGPMECSVLLYSTSASRFNGAAFGQIIVDGNCNGNLFTGGYLSAPPVLYGTANHVFANGQQYASPK